MSQAAASLSVSSPVLGVYLYEYNVLLEMGSLQVLGHGQNPSNVV